MACSYLLNEQQTDYIQITFTSSRLIFNLLAPGDVRYTQVKNHVYLGLHEILVVLNASLLYFQKIQLFLGMQVWELLYWVSMNHWAWTAYTCQKCAAFSMLVSRLFSLQYLPQYQFLFFVFFFLIHSRIVEFMTICSWILLIICFKVNLRFFLRSKRIFPQWNR